MRNIKQCKQSLPQQMEEPYEGMISTCQYDLHLKPENFHFNNPLYETLKTKYITLTSNSSKA